MACNRLCLLKTKAEDIIAPFGHANHESMSMKPEGHCSVEQNSCFGIESWAKADGTLLPFLAFTSYAHAYCARVAILYSSSVVPVLSLFFGFATKDPAKGVSLCSKQLLSRVTGLRHSVGHVMWIDMRLFVLHPPSCTRIPGYC